MHIPATRPSVPTQPYVNTREQPVAERLPLADVIADWTVRKRTGQAQKFDHNKIIQAVSRCYTNQMGWSLPDAVAKGKSVAARVVSVLAGGEQASFGIEEVQDAVIRQLWADGEYQAATAYTLYREERRLLREERPIDPEVERRFKEDSYYLPSPIQYYQFVSKFARWRDADNRRETWVEANERVFAWLATIPEFAKLTDQEVAWLREMLLNMKATPALRVLQMAGPALERCHIGVYNCAAHPIVDLFAFAELLYILMQGSGGGFSVESDFISRLPRVRRQRKGKRHKVHHFEFEDSTESWCEGLYFALQKWFAGEDVTFGTGKIRPAGTRLKTKGGRASGPEPLLDLLAFVRKVVLGAQGRHLTDLECHDICCKIAKIVHVGGVRRASTISLSDLDSVLMRTAKHGDWYVNNLQRSMANNSAVYDGRPPVKTFMSEFKALVDSDSGERGIFNRDAVTRGRPARRKRARFICNPCAEIVLRLFGLCNLSIAVARVDDTEDTLKAKVRAATYFGKLQSMCTNFRFVRPEWKKNCEEERLLGVDITGHADCPLLRFGAPGRADLLRRLKAEVDAVDAELSERFGTARSAANTTVKPSGDSSELFGCAAGASPRFAQFGIRRVRENKASPIAAFMIAQGVPHETAMEDEQLWAFAFPKEAPAGATLRDDMTAVDQLNNWLEWKRCWAEHSVSVSIYVKDHEWPAVQAWVWEHFDEVSGIALFPWDNGSYRTVPNEALTREQYEAMTSKFPTLQWVKLQRYELEDSTAFNRAVACSGDACAYV